MKAYSLSRRAERDIDEIAEGIAAQNPRAAERLIDAFAAKFLRIADNPLGYAAQAEIASDFRRAVLWPYGIWFRVLTDGHVSIERVVHGARDVTAIFPPES